MHKKMKHHPDDHEGHLNPFHHKSKKMDGKKEMPKKKMRKTKMRVKKEGSKEMYA